MSHIDRLEARNLLTSVAIAPWAYVADGALNVGIGWGNVADAQINVEKGHAKITISYSFGGGTEPQVHEQTIKHKKGASFRSVKIVFGDGDDVAVIRSDIPVQVDARGGDDRITLHATHSTAYGGDGDDTLISSPTLLTGQPEQATERNVGRTKLPGRVINMIAPSLNVLEGNAGNDRLETRGGDDRLHGGAGHDTAIGLNRDIAFKRGALEGVGFVPEVRIVLESRTALFSVEAIGRSLTAPTILTLHNAGLPGWNGGRPIELIADTNR